MADDYLNHTGLDYFWTKIKAWVKALIATDSEYGMVKLNPNESVTLNSNGQLDVGGRLGAFSGTTGIFHSKDRRPRNVGDFYDVDFSTICSDVSLSSKR